MTSELSNEIDQPKKICLDIKKDDVNGGCFFQSHQSPLHSWNAFIDPKNLSLLPPVAKPAEMNSRKTPQSRYIDSGNSTTIPVRPDKIERIIFTGGPL